ncbi:MAG TPA: hypothetical protein DEW46_03920, partial [Verrucomicrobia bacterium]|nr:hypothetical protein [Verrucomicrobiota bacterium]
GENATASSAGGSPNPDGEVRLGKRLPFRTTSNHQALGRLRGRSKIPGRKTLPFDFDTDF